MDGVTDATGMFYKSLPLIIVNGATLLIVVVMMIRRGAKSEERLINSLTFAITGLKDEVIGLRRDIRETGTANAVAIGLLTQRVSRIEGMMRISSEMGGMPHEDTGVHRMQEADDDFREQPTPVHPLHPLGIGKRTPPHGIGKTPPGGVYGLAKPPRGKP